MRKLHKAQDGEHESVSEVEEDRSDLLRTESLRDGCKFESTDLGFSHREAGLKTQAHPAFMVELSL